MAVKKVSLPDWVVSDVGLWPVRIDEEYGFPVIACGAWTTYRGNPRQCDYTLTGRNLNEFRCQLERHITLGPHISVPEPWSWSYK